MRLDEFLLARIAKDEEVARALLEPYAWGYSTFWEASPTELEHIARHDPARVLADCAAKRLLVQQFRELADDGPVASDEERLAFWAMRLLAQPFADHPDFDLAWGDTPTST